MLIGIVFAILGIVLAGSGGYLTYTGGIAIPNIVMIVAGIVSFLIFLAGLTYIPNNEVGIRKRKMFGAPMPQGRIIARDDEIGVQADTLMPGLYWYFPFIWTILVKPITIVGDDEVGLVTSIDGEPLPPGRLLGDEIECDSYQDAARFLKNHGRKGPQIAILRPGEYRINTEVFEVTKKSATMIKAGKLGVVLALDGKALPTKLLIAPKPVEEEGKVSHNFFQNGQAFIGNEGYRGSQLDTLQPGKYYLNTMLFNIEEVDQGVVAPGYVAVIISNVGEELVSQPGVPPGTGEKTGDEKIHEEEEVVLQTDMNKRGIIAKPVAAGSYNLNPKAYKVVFVPISAITIDWAAEKIRAENPETEVYGLKKPGTAIGEKAAEFFKFSALRVTSVDGFQLDVDVRLIIRILPEYAAYIIARFGSVQNLIDQIVHPLIDSSFRNKAGEEKALQFVQSRSKLQEDALDKARKEFEKYHVETKNLLIAYIDVDKEVLKTLTEKELASLRKEQYLMQAEAQVKLMELNKKTAEAKKQSDLVDSEYAIKINTNQAKAVVAEAEGTRDARKAIGEGEAAFIENTGKAKGAEPEAVGMANAKAYLEQVKALGPNQTMMVAIAKAFADGKVDIVPKINVSDGGKGGTASGLEAVIMGWLIQTGNLDKLLASAAKEAAAGTADTPIDETGKTATEMSTDASKDVSKETATQTDMKTNIQTDKISKEAVIAPPKEPPKETKEKGTAKPSGKEAVKKETKRY